MAHRPRLLGVVPVRLAARGAGGPRSVRTLRLGTARAGVRLPAGGIKCDMLLCKRTLLYKCTPCGGISGSEYDYEYVASCQFVIVAWFGIAWHCMALHRTASSHLAYPIPKVAAVTVQVASASACCNGVLLLLVDGPGALSLVLHARSMSQHVVRQGLQRSQHRYCPSTQCYGYAAPWHPHGWQSRERRTLAAGCHPSQLLRRHDARRGLAPSLRRRCCAKL